MSGEQEQGTYGRIEECSPSTVTKKAQRRVPKGSLSISEQKAIHALIGEITTSYTIIRVPYLVSSDLYEMERVRVDKPIFLGCAGSSVLEVDVALLGRELESLWRALYKKGYAAWDFELYLQPDGRVVILDFDKFKKGLQASPEEAFFIHPSFPRGFKPM